jgi:GT2 family glycosyltransferase
MLRMAKGSLVLSLDDDSHPIQKDFLQTAEALFVASEKLAVAWFPQRSDEFPESLNIADFGPERFTGSYLSSGAAIRRKAYLKLPGYVPWFEHAYEEPDFSLQCWASGWEVRFFPKLTIRHRYSARNRNEMRTHLFHSSNEQLSALLRCPRRLLPWVMARRLLGQGMYAVGRGPKWIFHEPLWWARAVRLAGKAWRERAPVPPEAYRKWLSLP